MADEFIPFSPPCLDDAEIAEVGEAIRSGWISTGPRTQLFAARFGELLGARAVAPVSSCTAALHLALVVHGIGPGDEVVTTPMTFCSTVHVIEQVGATPVLADVEPDTLNLSPATVAAAITPRTRAILPVHFGGHPVDLDPLLELARDNDLAVIEDAAHALPAAYRGRTIGAAGNLAAFSFYATKNVAMGEGGALTGDPELVERARILSLHGMSRDAWVRYGKGGSWFYEVVAAGFKYNLSDLQAAMGLVQLGKLERFQARRREVVDLYRAEFGPLGAFDLPVERPDCRSAWQLFPLRLREERWTIDRDRFIAEMTAAQIGTSVHFIPITHHRYYRERFGFAPADCPVASAAYPRLVSLPLHPGLTDGDLGRIVDAVRDIFARSRR